MDFLFHKNVIKKYEFRLGIPPAIGFPRDIGLHIRNIYSDDSWVLCNFEVKKSFDNMFAYNKQPCIFLTEVVDCLFHKNVIKN